MTEEKKERVWTTANLFSFLRILLVPLFLCMMVRQKPLEAFLVFLIACSTDLLDGFAARLFNQRTHLGGLLDPAADKLLLTSGIIVLSLPGLSRPNTIPAWLTAVIISRDVAIVSSAYVLFRKRRQKRFPPSLWGKSSTVCQMGTALLVLLFNVLGTSPPQLFWLYVLTFFVSGVHYGLWGYRILSGPVPRSSCSE